MKRILFAVMMIVLTLGLVSGVGYALFSDSAELNGIVLGTATPKLKIGTDVTGSMGWYDALDLPDNAFDKLMPGNNDWGEFYLKNESNADTLDPLKMNITAKLDISAVGGNWEELKSVIQARFCEYDGSISAPHCKAGTNTPWYTLDQWRTERQMPGGLLDQGGDGRHYSVELHIPSGFDNAVAGKTVNGLKFIFNGTQVN